MDSSTWSPPLQDLCRDILGKICKKRNAGKIGDIFMTGCCEQNLLTQRKMRIKWKSVHFFITVNFSSSRLSLIPRIIPFPRWIKVLLVVQLHSQSSCLSTKCKYKVQVHTSKVKSSLSLKQWPAAKKLRQCPLSITDLAQMPRRTPKA